MTTITVPRATWDALREALKHGIREMNLSGKAKECMPLHQALTAANAASHPKTETAPVTEGGAITAESAANAVSEQKGLFVDLIASHGPEFAAEMAATDPQAQGEAWVWNPASTEWEKVRALGHWHQCAIYAFGSTQPEPLAHPQATEPAGKTRDPLDLGQYVNEANISANDKPVAVIEKLQAVINVKKAFQ